MNSAIIEKSTPFRFSKPPLVVVHRFFAVYGHIFSEGRLLKIHIAVTRVALGSTSINVQWVSIAF